MAVSKGQIGVNMYGWNVLQSMHTKSFPKTPKQIERKPSCSLMLVGGMKAINKRSTIMGILWCKRQRWLLL